MFALPAYGIRDARTKRQVVREWRHRRVESGSDVAGPGAGQTVVDSSRIAAVACFDGRKENTVRRSATNDGDLLQGTLDMLVLKSLQLGPMHGWGIADRVEQGSQNVLGLNQGSLYPALYRLEKQGFIRSEWRMTEKSRRARYYTLTPAGRRQLATERAEWERLSSAVNQVLRMSEG
jgi:PadR family transcriptional regulator PadR